MLWETAQVQELQLRDAPSAAFFPTQQQRLDGMKALCSCLLLGVAM